MENPNRSITSKKIETVIKSPQQQRLGPYDFTVEFSKHLQKNEHQPFLHSPKKLKRREHFLTYYMRAA